MQFFVESEAQFQNRRFPKNAKQQVREKYLGKESFSSIHVL